MKNILKKLIEVKKEVGKISKDSENPFYKSKYFDINKLLEHIEPILSSHGLICLQPIKENKVYSRVYDVDSSEFIESYIEIPEIKDPQKLGSAITYFRRYTLQSLLSLQAEDDDANLTTKQPTHANNTASPEKWLNIYTTKDKKEITKEFKDCWNAVNGGSYSVSDIRKKYKVSKDTQSKLEDANFLS